MAVARHFVGQGDMFGSSEAGRVASGQFAAVIVPGIDVLELGAENGGVNVVQPAVETETVDIAGVRTVVPQLPHFFVHLRIIGDKRAAIAESAQILLNDEARGGGIAQFGDLKPSPAAPMPWALSSMTNNLCWSAIARMAFISAHWP